MKHPYPLSFLICLISLMLGCATPDNPVQNPYAVDEQQTKEALDLFQDKPPQTILSNTHPDAQWFPKAGLGLFMHWGIHSVAGIQPSWAMIKDYPAGGDPKFHPPEKYYALADKFDPKNYDPDKWMAAARKAGFSYAVLTAKHHDGYALWPTKYGDMNTRRYLGGRDLLRPYVSKRLKFSPVKDPEQNQRNFEKFFADTIGQLRELLIQYGKIEILWFDGISWYPFTDMRTTQTLDWVRKL
jgi:alpha-L-fucosidase